MRAIASGGDVERLAIEIDRAISDGGGGLLSFGLAGGLEPSLPPGSVVIASQVMSGGERIATDDGWRQRLRVALPEGLVRAVAGVDTPVASLSAKQALYALTGAAAADLESHVAARAAARADLPFAALRAIADPAERALPHAAVVGMGSDGRPALGAVLRSLAHNPAQLVMLLRVAADARRGMAALARCKRLLGASFGFRVDDPG
jgi:adenosylhomocysteine nucleosidase